MGADRPGSIWISLDRWAGRREGPRTAPRTSERSGSVWIGLDPWEGCRARPRTAPRTVERHGSVRIALDRWRGGETDGTLDGEGLLLGLPYSTLCVLQKRAYTIVITMEAALHYSTLRVL